MRSEYLHNLYTAPNILRVVKSKRVIVATDVALRVAKQVCAEFRQENKGKRQLERPRRMWWTIREGAKCHAIVLAYNLILVIIKSNTFISFFFKFCVSVHHSISQMKHQLHATLCRFHFCRVTLHVSCASAHHKEYLKLVRRPLVRVLSLQVSHHISLLGPKLNA